jgi:hypothetical protein
VDIPGDLEPFDAALAIYKAVHPTAADELKARIKADDAALADWVDAARTRTGMLLGEFVRRAAVHVQRRNTLESRLARLEGTQPRARPSPEAEIHDLVRSIRRWADGEALRAERQTAIVRLNRELDHCEWTIRHLAASHGNTRAFTPGSPQHKAHLVDSSDLWLSQMVATLNSRADLRERLAELGDDRQARGKTISVVLGSLGELAVVESVAPRMMSPDFSASRLKAALRDIDSRLAGLDSETKLYRQLQDDRRELQDSLGEAQAKAEAHRTDLARRLVSEASSGSLEHCTELARYTSHPELSKALADARGQDSHLIAAVAELMGERSP